jgi:hypothetical protein
MYGRVGTNLPRVGLAGSILTHPGSAWKKPTMNAASNANSGFEVAQHSAGRGENYAASFEGLLLAAQPLRWR